MNAIEAEPADDTRREFYSALERLPETEEALARLKEKARRWRVDPRFAAFWPQLEFILSRDLDHFRKWLTAHEAVRHIQEDGGLDYESLRAQDECDLRHANDHL